MPKIKHTILVWARETAKLSVIDAARKLQIRDSKTASAGDKLAAYERGDKAPSRSLLKRMSKQYHRPLLIFYLDEPPTTGDRGEDFRTLPDQYGEIENAHVDVLVRDIKARQSTVRETLIDADEGHHLTFIGKHNISDGVDSVVQTIREALDIDLNAFRHQSNYKESFRFLRHNVEASGVFIVLQGNLGSYHSNIAPDAFRGFALADDIAPFIVINDRDAPQAWSFTVIHELAHLVLGQTGISGAYGERRIERFCNSVASEFLLPTEEFGQFRVSSFKLDMLQSEVSNYAETQKLSSSHIAYRLYLRGDIDKPLWTQLRTYYREQWLANRHRVQEKNREKEGGPSYWVVKQYKLGALVNLVERLTYSGALTTTKAGMLLDVKPLKVHRLFESGQPA